VAYPEAVCDMHGWQWLWGESSISFKLWFLSDYYKLIHELVNEAKRHTVCHNKEILPNSFI